MRMEDKTQLMGQRLSRLDSLLRLGFKYSGVRSVSSGGAAGPSFEYVFERKNVSVEIVFFPEHKNEDDYVLVYILRSEKKAEINLVDWLRKHGYLSGDEFDLSSYRGSFINKVDALVVRLESAFSKAELMPILSGDSWEDIPFDWGGTR